jgi:hypothetical protein
MRLIDVARFNHRAAARCISGLGKLFSGFQQLPQIVTQRRTQASFISRQGSNVAFWRKADIGIDPQNVGLGP